MLLQVGSKFHKDGKMFTIKKMGEQKRCIGDNPTHILEDACGHEIPVRQSELLVNYSGYIPGMSIHKS